MAIYPLLTSPIDNVYSVLAVLLFVGSVFGFLMRQVRLPSITGNVLAGLLLGPLFGVVVTTSPKIDAQFEPICSLALCLIAISIGSHLRFQRLHNAFKRILVIALTGSIVAPLLVFAAIYATVWYGPYPNSQALTIATFMAVLSIATASATVVHVVKEASARGLLVKTLMAVVVCNNALNILLFDMVNLWSVEGSSWASCQKIVLNIGLAVLLGVGIASLLPLVWKRIRSRRKMVTFSFAALFVVYGLAVQFNLSPVLANLALGITLANITDRNEILDLFEDFEGVIYCIFFTLVGTHAKFDNLGSVGLLATVYFFARILGNLGAVSLSGLFTRLPHRISKYLGLAMTPQAGITIGFIVGLEALDCTGAIASYVTPAVLMAVTVSELVGPLILRIALKRTGEEGHAHPRLIDFIQEEYISVPLKGRHRTAIIEELVDFLFKTHRSLRKVNKQAVLQAILEREERGSTAMGYGVAIPHGRISSGPKICGVMGVIPEGIRWAPNDEHTVHMIILIATPPEHEQQHVGALATISKLFRRQSVTARGLHRVKTPAEAYEALADEEFSSLNQLLSEEWRPQSPGPFFAEGDHPRPSVQSQPQTLG